MEFLTIWLMPRMVKTQYDKGNLQFVQQYARITGDTLDARNIQLYGYRFKKNDFNRFYLDKKGKSMVYDMRTGILTQIKAENKKKERPVLKPSYHSSDSLFTMLGAGMTSIYVTTVQESYTV